MHPEATLFPKVLDPGTYHFIGTISSQNFAISGEKNARPQQFFDPEIASYLQILEDLFKTALNATEL